VKKKDGGGGSVRGVGGGGGVGGGRKREEGGGGWEVIGMFGVGGRSGVRQVKAGDFLACWVNHPQELVFQMGLAYSVRAIGPAKKREKASVGRDTKRTRRRAKAVKGPIYTSSKLPLV